MIKSYSEFISEESKFKNIVISLAALLSIGLSRSQVDKIKGDTTKMSIVSDIIQYNKNPMNIKDLTIRLSNKVDKPDKFIDEYLQLLPDKTVVVKPNFIKGVELNANPFSSEYKLSYTIKF